MSILTSADLAGLRALEEGEMVETFTASKAARTRVDGLDKDTMAVQYATPGRLLGRAQQGDAQPRVVEIGGVEREVLEGGLRIPLSRPAPSVGWVFECTAIGADSDPTLLGRRYQVVGVPPESRPTYRRVDVVDLDVRS